MKDTPYLNVLVDYCCQYDRLQTAKRILIQSYAPPECQNKVAEALENAIKEIDEQIHNYKVYISIYGP